MAAKSKRDAQWIEVVATDGRAWRVKLCGMSAKLMTDADHKAIQDLIDAMAPAGLDTIRSVSGRVAIEPKP